MYSRLLEFVPHHCRLLREVTGGAVSRYRCYEIYYKYARYLMLYCTSVIGAVSNVNHILTYF